MKKISLGAAIAVMAIVATLTFSITMVYSRQVFNDTMQNIKERESTYSKLSEIDKWVRQNYYGTIDNNALMDSIARGYIEGLGDPYARYMTVEEYSKLNQTGTSKSVGVGMVTEIDESGYLLVTEVYPDSPALAAGIAAVRHTIPGILPVTGRRITTSHRSQCISSTVSRAGRPQSRRS